MWFRNYEKKYTNEIVTLKKHTYMTTDSKVPPPPLHTQKYSPLEHPWTNTHTTHSMKYDVLLLFRCFKNQENCAEKNKLWYVKKQKYIAAIIVYFGAYLFA